MNSARAFIRQASALQGLVWLQRSLRLVLRAAWLGIAGYLLAWGFHSLTGVLADPQVWRLVGLLFAITPLMRALFSRPRLARLAWSADRKLGLKEQVSTALAVVKERQEGALASGLCADAAGLLRPVRKRVWFRGWFFGRELLALMIVGALLVVFELTTRLEFPAYHIEPAVVAAIPALPEEPLLADIVPGRVPGMPADTAAQPEAAGDKGSSAGASTSDLQALSDALRKIGTPLAGQSATQALSDALQSMDLNQAAEELQKLADQSGSLSQAVKDSLAQAMQVAAPTLDQAGLQELAADLSAAADALKDVGASNQAEVPDSLSQVAEDLQNLAGQMVQAADDTGQPSETPGLGSAAGQPGGVPQKGSSSTARLGGEGSNYELETGASAESGWLVPGAPGSTGTGTTAGSLDATSTGGDTVTSLLMPYYYPWMYQNVVSNYFQPQP